MSSYRLPPVSSIPNLTTDERIAALDALFEPCIALHTLSLNLLRSQAFESYNDLIAGVGKQLMCLLESISSSDKEWLDDILAAHPRLGEKNVHSEQSRGEQAQLNIGAQEETEKLRELNAEYEKAFPGLRYVVFVNGRSRPAIMDDMHLKIARADVNLERVEAIKAMCDIAGDRASRLQVT